MSDLEPGVQLSPDTIAAMERLSTSPPRNTMSEQHEATSEQWAAGRYDWSKADTEAMNGDPAFRCLLELRARVEALEATQHAHVDTSSLWQPVRSITPLNGDPSKRLPDPQPGKQPRVFAADEVAPIVVPSPAGSLVERVADAIAAQATSAGIVNDRPARAAIREVAAWFRRGNGAGSAWAVAADVLDAGLEQEAN